MMDLMAMMGGMGQGASNPDATPADSFTGGVEELESALMEGEEYVIDELQAPKKKPGNPMMAGQPGHGPGPGMGMGQGPMPGMQQPPMPGMQPPPMPGGGMQQPPMGGGQAEQDQMLMQLMQQMQGGGM